MLQAGSNDCCSDTFDINVFKEDYSALVKVASSITGSVVISGILPHLDDKFGNIAKGNECLAKITNDENCLFIDNDPSFRL